MSRTFRSKAWMLALILLLTFTFIVPIPATEVLAQDDSITLKILHTNDIHSNITDFGKITAYLQAEREAAEYALYLDAGDIFSGHPVVDLRNGRPMIDLLNHLGLQAMAIGNHEFDYGQIAYAKNVGDSNFPWLSANMHVVDPSIMIPQPDPYTIFDFGEFSVGVFALTEAPPSTAPAGIVGLSFDEDYAAVAGQYSYLRDEVDVLIALTHIGYPEDRQLAQAVDFFDLIIGGHSHTVLTQPVVVNGTPIAQAGSNAAYVGNISITLDRTTKDVQHVTGFLQNVSQLEAVDPFIQEKVDQYIADMDDILGQVIGYSNTGLSRNGRTSGDAPLGNFWTDAMRDMLQADIALTNNGGIRDSIAPGEITAGDIYRVEPFANEIMEIRMTGQAIKDVIEYSYSRRNQIDLQTSGLHYEIIVNPTGQYLDALLWVNGEPLDLERQYTVAVADYIGTGGSGYQFEGEIIQPSAGFMTNAMIAYAEKLMAEVGVIDYGTEGRIKITIDPSGGVPGEVIGQTQNGLSSTHKTERDAGLGNLYTDAVRARTNADLALINNSSVLGTIPPGDITVEQLISLDPYQNEIVLVRTTGQRIRDVILSQSNYYRGVDLQASGMTYTLIEGEGSERFADVAIELENGEALDLNGTYTVAYNDYMHGRPFYNLGNDVIEGSFGKVYEATIEYVRGHVGSIDYVEGERIQIQERDRPDLPDGVISVAEAIANNEGRATVQGYIVGTMTWNFDGTGTPFMATNLLLADHPHERDRSKILPVQLPQNHVRAALNLSDHPQYLGKQVRLTGNLANYYSQPGMRDTNAYEFVDVEPEPPQVLTIEEVRATGNGTAVITSGVVTTTPGSWGSQGFYIQDETSGIYVFQNSFNVRPGDVVQISGVRGSFNGEDQLEQLTALEVLNQAALPEPIQLDPQAVNKQNEGMLVRLEGVTIRNLRQVNQFGTFEFEAEKAGQRVLIRVDNRTGLDYASFAYGEGDVVHVTGVSSQYQGTFQVKPRGADDFEQQQQTVDLAALRAEIEATDQFPNRGAQRSVLAHLERAERHFALAGQAEAQGRERQVAQQQRLAVQALEKVAEELQRRLPAGEQLEKLLKMIDNILAQTVQ